MIKNLLKTSLFILGFSLCQFAFPKVQDNGESQTSVLNIQHWVVKETPVYFVQTQQPQLVDVRVAFAAGSSRDGAKYGLASLTNNMIDQGSETMTVDEIAESFAEHGAIYVNDTNRDMAILGFRSLVDGRQGDEETDHEILADVMAVFTDMLAQPTFPETELQRTKQQQLTAITYDLQSPMRVANRTFFETVYQGHPYGHPTLGTRLTVEVLHQQDVKDFFHKYYGANNAVIAIVGPIDKQQAQNMSEAIVAALPESAATTPLPAPQNAEEKTINRVDFPSAQTSIYMGQPAINYHSNDLYPLIVANDILGGGGVLTSRLIQNVREDRGLSYSTGSILNPMLVNGPFIIFLGTENSQAGEALEVVNQTLNDYIETGPTEVELDATKQYIVGHFPLRFDNNSSIVNQVITLGFYKLPLSYFDNYVDNINAVTLEQAHQAFKKHIEPNKMTTVIVGKKQEN